MNTKKIILSLFFLAIFVLSFILNYTTNVSAEKFFLYNLSTGTQSYNNTNSNVSMNFTTPTLAGAASKLQISTAPCGTVGTPGCNVSFVEDYYNNSIRRLNGVIQVGVWQNLSSTIGTYQHTVGLYYWDTSQPWTYGMNTSPALTRIGSFASLTTETTGAAIQLFYNLGSVSNYDIPARARLVLIWWTSASAGTRTVKLWLGTSGHQSNVSIPTTITAINNPPKFYDNTSEYGNSVSYQAGQTHGFQINVTEDSELIDKVIFETNLNSTLTNYTVSPYADFMTTNGTVNYQYVINFTDGVPASIPTGTYQYRWIMNDTNVTQTNSVNSTAVVTYAVTAGTVALFGNWSDTLTQADQNLQRIGINKTLSDTSTASDQDLQSSGINKSRSDTSSAIEAELELVGINNSVSEISSAVANSIVLRGVLGFGSDVSSPVMNFLTFQGLNKLSSDIITLLASLLGITNINKQSVDVATLVEGGNGILGINTSQSATVNVLATLTGNLGKAGATSDIVSLLSSSSIFQLSLSQSRTDFISLATNSFVNVNINSLVSNIISLFAVFLNNLGLNTFTADTANAVATGNGTVTVASGGLELFGNTSDAVSNLATTTYTIGINRLQSEASNSFSGILNIFSIGSLRTDSSQLVATVLNILGLTNARVDVLTSVATSQGNVGILGLSSSTMQVLDAFLRSIELNGQAAAASNIQATFNGVYSGTSLSSNIATVIASQLPNVGKITLFKDTATSLDNFLAFRNVLGLSSATTTLFSNSISLFGLTNLRVDTDNVVGTAINLLGLNLLRVEITSPTTTLQALVGLQGLSATITNLLANLVNSAGLNAFGVDSSTAVETRSKGGERIFLDTVTAAASNMQFMGLNSFRIDTANAVAALLNILGLTGSRVDLITATDSALGSRGSIGFSSAIISLVESNIRTSSILSLTSTTSTLVENSLIASSLSKLSSALLNLADRSIGMLALTAFRPDILTLSSASTANYERTSFFAEAMSLVEGRFSSIGINFFAYDTSVLNENRIATMTLTRFISEVASAAETPLLNYAGISFFQDIISIIDSLIGQLTQVISPPSQPSQPSAPSVGGGGISITPPIILPATTNIKFVKQDVISEVLAGHTMATSIAIKNKADRQITNLTVDVKGIPKEWVTIAPKILNIDINETKVLNIAIGVPDDTYGDYKVVIQLTDTAMKDESFFILRVRKKPSDPTIPTILRKIEIDNQLTRTYVNLTVNNYDRNYERIEIVEDVPKSIAESSDEIQFVTPPSKILRKDPQIQWDILDVAEIETRFIAYSVPKILEEFTPYVYWTLDQATIASKKVPVGFRLLGVDIPKLYTGKINTITFKIKNTDTISHNFRYHAELPINWEIKSKPINYSLNAGEEKQYSFEIFIPAEEILGQYIIRSQFHWDDDVFIKDHLSLLTSTYVLVIYLAITGILITSIIATILVVLKYKKYRNALTFKEKIRKIKINFENKGRRR